MPRYRLDVQHDGVLAHETEAQELPNLDAAREDAFTSARQMVAHALLGGSSLSQALRGVIIVKSENGDVLFTVDFMQSVEASTSAQPCATSHLEY